MENLEKGIFISCLIVKSLYREITPEEDEMLNAWLEENPGNREMYKRVRERRSFDERQEIVREINKQLAWKRVDRETREVKYYVLSRWVKFVAAVVLPLFIAAVSFYLIWESGGEASMVEVIKIKPGVKKAELVLADGQRVMLDAGTMDSLVKVKGENIVKSEDCIFYLGEENGGELVYNEMRVPRGGEFKVKLQDGTLVYLNSDSELRYPVRFVGKERRVYLSGEAYFEVRKDTVKPFTVVMDDSEVRVLGTEFNVRAYKDESYQFTTLVSGKVLFTTGSRQRVELLPNEQGVLDERGSLKKEKVDVCIYTAWKDGNFVFRKQRLEDIMKIVERWYDLRVNFEDEWCKDVTFSGNVERYEDFGRMAEMLEATGSVKFSMKDNEINISKR